MPNKTIKDLDEKVSIGGNDWLIVQPDDETIEHYKVKASTVVTGTGGFTIERYQPSSGSSGNGSSTGISISRAPLGAVLMFRDNFIIKVVGDGSKNYDAYFSSDGGTSALSLTNVTSSSVLYWNDTGNTDDGIEREALFTTNWLTFIFL